MRRDCVQLRMTTMIEVVAKAERLERSELALVGWAFDGSLCVRLTDATRGFSCEARLGRRLHFSHLSDSYQRL